jgi:hypothetical protein
MSLDEREYELASAEVMEDRDPVVMAALGPILLEEFSLAERDRRLVEQRWLQDIRQYRGQYDPEIEAALGANRSKAFVRKTRVKIKTVDSRVADLLFPAGSEKNWEIAPTPKPSVSDEMRQDVIGRLQEMVRQANAQQTAMAQQQGVDPSTVPPVRLARQQIDEAIKEVVRQASKKMGTAIEDQLVEARYKEVCIKAIHSGHLYGTGIIKGPLIERKIRTSFVEEGGRWVMKNEAYLVPFIDFVPLWRFYPDMSSNELSGCRYVFERHQMTRADFAELAERKSFKGDVIKAYIQANPNGRLTPRYVDDQLKIMGERMHKQGATTGSYEVLERWGWLDGEQLSGVGVCVPTDRQHESFFCNVWVLPTGEVIKAVMQPINGVTWPYHLYYFDKDETSIFGEGLATIMRDDQTMINAGTRMILDNAAITGGPMFEVNPSLLSKLDNVTEFGPWKAFLRNNANPGQRAVVPVEVPSKLAELSNIVQMFEANADEVTAIPRYMYGEASNQGAAGTASGMSMLMGAVNIVIKDLITAWDEGVTRSFLSGMYHWNMQFNPDPAIKGDFDVKARGTSSLVAKEVRARQLDAFSLSVANPIDAPFIKRDRLLRQRAEVNELSDVIKTEDEMKAEQEQGMAQQQMMQQQQQLQMALLQGQVAELQAKVVTAEANAMKAQVSAELDAAKAELIKAQTIAAKVEAVYSALQAGGTAASNPVIAPAGDEILRSAGWTDATPDPRIAELMGGGVQGADVPAQEPLADPQPVGGAEGMQAGIETPVIE